MSFLQGSFDLLCSFHGSPSEDKNFRSDAVDTKTEDASFLAKMIPMIFLIYWNGLRLKLASIWINLFVSLSIVISIDLRSCSSSLEYAKVDSDDHFHFANYLKWIWFKLS